MKRWGTENLPPGVTPGRHREPSVWTDGLVWAVLGLMAVALIFGLAIGQVVYG